MRRARPSKRTKRTTTISAVQLVKAQDAARYFGAEAVANDEGFDSYRDDIALRYGYEAWAKMPSDLRSDAIRHYTEGRRIEKRGGSL